MPPFYFEKIAFKWLETALDYGIDEFSYWNMTIAELMRLIESKKRQQKAQAQEKAALDYILADLIGRSVSRIYSSSNNMPSLEETYPSLFIDKAMEEKRQEKKVELSALRFKMFAQSYNDRFKKEVGGKNE